MKKVFAMALVVVSIIGTAAIASAERGDIGGIGTKENGSVWIRERGCIGGVGCDGTK